LTDEDPALRSRLLQVLFEGEKFQWKRLENLLRLAKEGTPRTSQGRRKAGVDLTATVADGARLALLDSDLRQQLLLAFTEDDRLHVDEVRKLLSLIREEIDAGKIVSSGARNLPSFARDLAVGWSDRVLSS